MTDESGSRISRRTILTGLATVGVAGAAGGTTTGLFSDEEHSVGVGTSGTVDLEASWTDGGDEASFGTVESAGDGGSEDLRLSVPTSANEAYVWARTGCEQCTELEEKLDVTIDLETGDGTTEVFDGTVGEARDALGSGVRLDGTLSPGEERVLTVSWELREPLPSDAEVEFAFGFRAIQARNVTDPAAYAPSWNCPEGCGDGSRESSISWVGFCAGSALDSDDVEFTIDGSTLELDGAPSNLGAVLLKYGTELAVFENPGTSGTFVAGEGETFDQQGNGFPDSGRSNPEPCLLEHGLKYEVGEEKWETKGQNND